MDSCRVAFLWVVLLLFVCCLRCSANVNPSPDHRARNHVPARGHRHSNTHHDLNATHMNTSLEDRSIPIRHMRRLRRFSRPHKLLNVTGPDSIKAPVETPSFVPDGEPVSSSSLWLNSPNEDHPEQKCGKASQARLAGGDADSLRNIPEHNESDTVDSDAGTADSEEANSEADSNINAPHMSNHTTTAHAVANSVNTAHPTPSNSASTKYHNSTFPDTHSIAITAQHYTQYIKPYIAWFIQYAGDTYESKLEQQKVIQIKRAVGFAPVKRGASSLFRVLRRSNSTNTTISSVDDANTTSNVDTNPDTSADTATDTRDTTFDTPTLQHLQKLKTELTHKHTLTQLQHTIDTLHSVVSTKDTSIRELVQRLTALEQELGHVRIAPINSAASSNAEHKGGTSNNTSTISGRDSSGAHNIRDCDAIATTAEIHPPARNTTTTTNTTEPTSDNYSLYDSYGETYDLLHGVLKTLHSVSVLMEQAAAENTLIDTASATSSDSTHTTYTGTLRISNAAHTNTTSTTNLTSTTNHTTIVYAPSIVPAVYPSIVDAVIQERNQQELRAQRVCDAAAVASIVLQSLDTECGSGNWSSYSMGGSSDNDSGVDSASSCGTTRTGDDNTNTQLALQLQAQIELLSNRTILLENELRLASLQLCKIRGQQYNPQTNEGEEDANKRSWFGWF